MKIRHLLMFLAAGAAVLASCSKEEQLSFPEFDAPASPYAEAQVKESVSAAVSQRFDQKYRTVTVSLAELGVTVAPDAVFYAPYDAQTDWCGEEWYTSEHGFYMSSKGYACYRSASDARMFVEYWPAGTNGASEPVLALGQIPDACAEGDSFVLNVGFATPQTKQPVKLSVTIKGALPWARSIEHPDGLTYTVYEEVNTDYQALEIPVNETAVKEALGLDSLAPLLEAMQSDTAFDTTMRGVNSNGEYDSYAKYTANVAGYWFNQNGDVCEWKGEKWGAFVEWDRTSPMIFRVGQAVENNVVGSRYDMKIALIHGDKEAVLTFKLAIVAEVGDDLGMLQ